MKLLITGCCGFIGFHLSKKLLNKNLSVIGIDNINNYYDTRLKKERLLILKNIRSLSTRYILSDDKIIALHTMNAIQNAFGGGSPVFL